MNRRALLIALLPLVPSLSGCADVLAPQEAQAQTTELATIQAMLQTVIERLDSLEASHATHDVALMASVDTLSRAVDNIGVEVGVGGSVSGGISTQVEGSICAKYAWEADARFRSAVTLRGQADGMVGVDAYGNGGKGRISAYGGQMVSVIPAGGAAVEATYCTKLVGQTAVEADAGVGVTLDVSDPVVSLLDDLTQSVGTTRLTNAASARSMSGARVGQALDALSGFSMSSLPFGGGGGASSLINALPLPQDMSTALNDPSSIFSQAGDAAQFAIDQVCGPALRVGEFAAVVAAGCDLRSQVPPPATVIDIISGLDGLPSTVSGLETSMASVCGAMGSITPQRLTIPSRSVTILSTSYTTFPGYDARLFPGLSAPC